MRKCADRCYLQFKKKIRSIAIIPVHHDKQGQVVQKTEVSGEHFVPAQFCTRKLMAFDHLRISEADKAAKNNSMAGRVKRRLARKKLKDEYADKERSVPTYQGC